jgi:endonuclease III
MKDSKEYSPRLTKLVRSLKRGAEKCQMPVYADPIEAVVYALISEPMTEAAAARTFKRMKSHFIDLNDLRVSRVEEIVDIFRDASEAAEKSARAVTQVLNTIFDKTDRISLDTLSREGKRQAHKELSDIAGITPFAVDYCFLTALGGHAIPLTERMLDYLKTHQVVHPEATMEEIAGFLERQIPASDAYEFYIRLRNEVEQNHEDHAAAPASKKKTAGEAKTTAKKTVKKAAAKKQNHKDQ